MTEAELQQTVIESAQVLGWRVAHFRPAMTAKGWRTPVEADGAGFPDLLMIRDDQIIVAELKREDKRKGRVRQSQREWLEAFAGAGVYAATWRPSHLLSGMIHEVLRRRSRPVTVDDVRGIAPDMTVNPWEDEG